MWQQALKTMVIQSYSWTRYLSAWLGRKKPFCRWFRGFNSWRPIELLISYLYSSYMKHVNVKTHNLDVGFQKSLQFMNFLCMTLNFGVLCSIVQKIWRLVFFWSSGKFHLLRLINPDSVLQATYRRRKNAGKSHSQHRKFLNKCPDKILMSGS